MTDGWAVLDTAVKVGLGALISGITTYLILSRTQKHDLLKSAIDDASGLLKEGALKMEKSSSSLNSAIHEYDCVVTRGGARKDLINASALALSAYNEGKEAKVYFYLTGTQELAALVTKYLDAVELVREIVGDESKPQQLDPDALGAPAQAASEARNSISENLGQAYQIIRGSPAQQSSCFGGRAKASSKTQQLGAR